MKSEKSKVLGALLPSEQCHDEFELALCFALRLFLVFEKKII